MKRRKYVQCLNQYAKLPGLNLISKTCGIMRDIIPMLPETPDLSVVIPALNEGKNVLPLISGLRKVLDNLHICYEIIVIDGGSLDDTRQQAERHGARCLMQRYIGYGGALREGFLAARGEYIVTMDCDLSHPPEFLPELWRRRGEADIIVASRFIKGGRSDASPIRQALSRILNAVFCRALAFPVRDSSSGFRLYRRPIPMPDRRRFENFNVLQEILVQAYVNGCRIEEIPFHYRARQSGSSHVSFMKFALSYTLTLYRLCRMKNPALSPALPPALSPALPPAQPQAVAARRFQSPL